MSEKKDLYTQEFLYRSILPKLSFKDAVALLMANKKLVIHPIVPSLVYPYARLNPFWELFLIHHWQPFIRNNTLAKMKRLYKWQMVFVVIILTFLRKQLKQFESEVGVGNPPVFYVPKTFTDDGETMFLYTQVLTIWNYTNATSMFVTTVEEKESNQHLYRIENNQIRKQILMENGTTFVTFFDMTTNEKRLTFASDIYETLRFATSIELHHTKPYLDREDLEFNAEILRNNQRTKTFRFQIHHTINWTFLKKFDRPNQVLSYSTRLREYIAYKTGARVDWYIVITRR